MKGTDRMIFIERIQAALAEGARGADGADSTSTHRVDHQLIRRSAPSIPGQYPTLMSLFMQRATAVGMGVRSCGPAQLSSIIVSILQSAGCGRVQLSEHPLLDEKLASTLVDAGVQCAANPVDLDDLYQRVSCGITVAQTAVARTGSVVVTSSGGESRLTSLVPPLHLVIVPASSIVEDLLDLAISGEAVASPLSRPAELPSCVTLVTGPSKTADIEGVLITGVHGPGVVEVIVLE